MGPGAAAAIVAVVLYAVFFRRIGKAHFSWDANLLALAGLPLFSYLLLRSRSAYKSGNVSWKGRRYLGSSDSTEVRANRLPGSRQDTGAASYVALSRIKARYGLFNAQS